MTDVEVRGRYLKGDGTAASGQVTFTPRPQAVNDSGDGDILVSSAVIATLDVAGEFEVTLQASDDPTLAPTNWTYLVAERIAGSRGLRTYDIVIPTAAAVAGVDLWDVAPVDPSSGDPTTFPTLAAFAALDGRVDDLRGANAVRTTTAAIGRLQIDGARAVNAAVPLTIPTYVPADDAIVHPDVVFVPEGWNGHKYWLAATPYTAADNQYENPSIWCSDDGLSWTVPSGLTNPVEPGTGVVNSYYSDTDLVLGADGTMYLFFRWNLSPREVLYLRTSTDGVTWTPKVIVKETVQSVSRLISPAVLFDGLRWHMWAVENVDPAARKIVHLTAAAAAGPWSAPVDCTISLPKMPCVNDAGSAPSRPWHLDALHVGGQFLALVTFNIDAGSGGRGQLYLAASTDGTAWARAPRPVLDYRTGYWDQSVYRATAVLVQRGSGLGLAIWYSAISNATVFQIGYTEAGFADLAETVAARRVAALSGVAPGVAGDLFQRPDSAVAMGTAPSGQPWTVSAGTAGIAAAMAYAVADANTRMTIPGVADVRVGVDLIAMPALTKAAYIIVRYLDVNNYIRVGRAASNIFYVAEKVEAGAVTTLAASSGDVPVVAGERWEIEAKGDLIKLTVDGLTAFSVQSSFNQASTGVGLQTSSLATRFDNFVVEAI